ncbi:MAG: phospholipase D-like domain-containing protein [Candidatus Saccharimonadales bacterium]
MATNSSLPDTTFKVLEAEAYYRHLAALLPRAKKRIVIAAMTVLWGDKTGVLLAEVGKAFERGVQVHILLDVFTRLGTGAQDGRKVFREQWRKTVATLDDFRKKGARVDMVGKIGLNPFKGRYHAKVTVIDDDCFAFGGINFVDIAFANHDFMLHTTNVDLADCLAQLIDRIGRAYVALPDGEVPLGDNTTILFDGGRPKHSIIYERALQLTRQSERVWFVSQMAPSGPLARALKATDAVVYFNRPEQVVEAVARWAQAFDQQRYRTVNAFRGQEYIHAKYMLFELFDGTKALITGSNNFSYRGIAFGTQEIAIYSTDTGLWNHLYKFINQHINPA